MCDEGGGEECVCDEGGGATVLSVTQLAKCLKATCIYV